MQSAANLHNSNNIQQIQFLSNQNKELVYDLLQDNIKKKYRIMLSDIPDFVRILEDTFVDVERSLNKQSDTTTKNKQVIAILYKYINDWISGQTIQTENKQDILNRNYEAAKQDFAKYKVDVQKPTIDLQQQLNKEAENMKEQYSIIKTEDAYSLMMAQREREETQLKQLQKQNEEVAKVWLNPNGVSTENTENHNKIPVKSNIVDHNKPSFTIEHAKAVENVDVVKQQPTVNKKITRDTIKRQLPDKTVMFNNTIEVIDNDNDNNVSNFNTPSEQEFTWWNKNNKNQQLFHIDEKTLVTKNLHDNVISLNESFSNYKSLHINNIALPNRTIKQVNDLDMEILSKISVLPYIYVEIYINGNLQKASPTQHKYMYRQDKEVGNYIYFTCNMSINSENNPLITTMRLMFYDDHEEPLNVTPSFNIETLINGSQITNKINKNTKFNDSQLSYIKIANNDTEFAVNEIIEIDNNKYKIVGVCKINIRDVDQINIEGLNQSRDYNTMIIQLDKEIQLDSKIMNLSRLPMTIVTVVK